VLLHSEVVAEDVELRTEADDLMDVSDVTADVVPTNECLTTVVLHKATEDVDESRLAGAIRPKKPKALADVNMQSNALQRMNGVPGQNKRAV
jgi:hypothetical protein